MYIKYVYKTKKICVIGRREAYHDPKSKDLICLKRVFGLLFSLTAGGFTRPLWEKRRAAQPITLNSEV